MLVDGINSIGEPRYPEAVQLLKKGADRHSAQAEHLLGLLYEYGKGVPQDFQMSRHYYSRAAEQRNVESIYNLGLLYAFGRGAIPQDFHRALALFQQGAQLDHAPSLYYLGVMKMHGHGTFVDYEEALHWFEKAAILDDFRVSEKASEAYQELFQLIEEAKEVNDKIAERFIIMNEAQ